MSPPLHIILSITGCPEVLASLRHEVAEILRDEAEAAAAIEDVRTATSLRRVASAFEAGTRPGPEDAP